MLQGRVRNEENTNSWQALAMLRVPRTGFIAYYSPVFDESFPCSHRSFDMNQREAFGYFPADSPYA